MTNTKNKLKVLNKHWSDLVSLEEANEQHMQNVTRITEMFERRKDKKRPVHVVGIAGSNRSPNNTSQETSNSWLMLRKALEYLSHQDSVTTHAFNLPSLNIEHCNGCYSSAGSLCHYPCDCAPFDDMQEIYAQLTLADVIIFSSPVNQFLPGSRLKVVLDRLISMDGGRFAPMYNVDGQSWKDAETKNAEQRVSMRGDFRYVQRLAGKVCVAFSTCKDYGSFKVAQDILAGMNMYGCFIPPNAVVSWNSPRVQKDTAFDKNDFLKELESGGWLGNRIEKACDTALETALLVRGHESEWMDEMVGRT